MKKSMCSFLRAAGLSLGCLTFSSMVSAGVMVTEKDDGGQSQSLFQSNVVYQIQNGQLNSKFDLNRNQCSLAMPHMNMLVEGNCKVLFDSLNDMKNKTMGKVNAMRDAMMKNMSPEQRKMMQQMGMPQEDKVSLVKAGASNIKGYPVQRYDMVQNGDVIHSVWVSKKLLDQILKEVDKDKVAQFRAAIVSGDDSEEEFSSQIDKYVKQLEDKGETMRVAKPDWDDSGDVRSKTIREVINVEQKNFSTSQYQFPKGLRKVDAAKFGEELAKQMPAFLR